MDDDAYRKAVYGEAVEIKYDEVIKSNETSVMEEENRFKVVEIKKYNEEIKENEKEIRDRTICVSIFGLGLVSAILAIIPTSVVMRIIMMGFAYFDSVNLLVYSKKLMTAICKKVVLEQKLMDIESHIDERVKEMLNNVQLEIDRRMQESIEGGKQR